MRTITRNNPSLNRNNIVLDGIPHQFSISLQLQSMAPYLWEATVRRGDFQYVCRFFHRAPFSQELNYFPLPESGFSSFFTRLRSPEKDIGLPFCGAWRHIGTTVKHFLNCLCQFQRRRKLKQMEQQPPTSK